MKAIQIFNAVALAAAASFAATMGVVALLYAVYLEEAPRLREDWPAVATTASVFFILTLVAGLTFYAHRRDKGWRWPMEAALFASIAGGGWVLYRTLI